MGGGDFRLSEHGSSGPLESSQHQHLGAFMVAPEVHNMTICRSTFAILAVATTSLANAAAIDSSKGAKSLEGSYLVQASGAKFPVGFAAFVESLGGKVTFAHNGVGVGAVSGLSAEAAAALGRMKGIAAVEEDDFTAIPKPAATSPEGAESTIASPSDPTTAARYARQWHLRQIEAPAAWAAGRLGEPTTKVGILDTGLAYTHADLDGRVDLNLSKSFVPEDDMYVDYFFPGANHIADLHYHGTHVGATVASNAVAAAGVTSGLTLVGIKVCSAVLDYCPTSAVLQGVLYAADLGLPVANMSLGGYFERREASARGGYSPSFIAIINSVFNYAYRKGTTVVVSAGNDAIDIDHDKNSYKAYCSAPHVVCVSATGPTDRVSTDGPWTDPDALAYYSNYGRSAITVAAPGGNGEVNFSYVWAACSTFSLVIPACQTGNFIVGLGGTSMAAPHASATAALISEETGNQPAMIVSRLRSSADDLGQPGTDPAYGSGRINVRKAVGE